MMRFPKNIILKEVEKKIIELVILLNEKGEFLQVSRHILRLLGFEESDLLGGNITSLFEQVDWNKFSTSMLKQEIEYSDIHMTKKNGETLPVQIMCVPIIDDILQEYLGSLLVIRDISKEYELDIDHFKKINDNHGHLFGDYVIQTISDILREAVGQKGYAGRFGGEEFIVILPDLEIKEASDIGEKIRKYIYQYQYREPIEVTISIGMIQLGEESSMQLLKNADDLLYKAKQNGRNRLELSTSTSSSLPS